MSNDLYINKILDEYLQRQRNQEETIELLGQAGVADPVSEMTLHHSATVALQRQAIIDQVKRVHEKFLSGSVGSITGKDSPPVIKISARRRLISWSIRIAAVLIIAAGAWYVFQYSTNTTKKLYAELYQPYQINTDRSGIKEVVPHRMIEEFGQKNYQGVVSIFEGLPEKGNRERFLAALAYSETGKDEAAIEQFHRILEENSKDAAHLYNDQAEFYLALAYLRLGNIKDAVPLFQKIHDDPYHTYHTKAGQKVMQRLRWLE